MSDEEIVLVDPPPLDQQEIENLVGTKIKTLSLFRKAFTHKSALKKYTLTESFETLEFMGDSVLGFVITKMLFDRFEKEQEGFLTKARTKLVRGNTLASIARKLKLDQWILMDDKGIRNGWNSNDKILEDVFEALIGAIYMDIGLLHVKEFILKIYNDPDMVDMNCLNIDDNFKDQLMRYCQMQKMSLPTYDCVQIGNKFTTHVRIGEQEFGTGDGTNKKSSEQNAAYSTLVQFREITP
jgi:ribonuclease-3